MRSTRMVGLLRRYAAVVVRRLMRPFFIISHAVRAAALGTTPRAIPALVEQIRELLALLVVEDRVDVANRVERRAARLCRRAIELAEHGAEGRVIDHRAANRGGQIAAAVFDAALRALQALFQLCDFRDDRALLRGRRVEMRERHIEAAPAASAVPAK